MLLSRYRKAAEKGPEKVVDLAARVESVQVEEVVQYEEYTKAELKAEMDRIGLSYSQRDSKEKMLEALKKAISRVVITV